MSITTGTFPGVRIADMPDLGPFTSTSSIVGERAGSGRFSASALGGYFLPMASGGTVTGPTGFYATDWLTPLISWPVASSHMPVLSPDGRMAITGASNTAQGVGVAFPVAIGVSGFGFASRTGTSVSDGQAWGGYFEARQYPGVTAPVWGVEIDIVNVSGVLPPIPNPYALLGPLTTGITLVSGGGVQIDTPPLSPLSASVALVIGNNGATFERGIMFTNNALSGTNGNDGQTSPAISLATGHVIDWTMPGGTPGPAIFSLQTSGQPAQLVFDNGVGYFRGTGSATVLFGVTTVSLTTLGQTAVQLAVWNNLGVNDVPVSIGAPDSGGTGYRALRVPN